METERIHNLTEKEYMVQIKDFKEEEQESAKKPLTIDKDKMSVPFKKRKQRHEESDSYFISTDQNPQMCDQNEEINATFCPKIIKEDFHESIPSSSHKACSESKIEFNLQSSVFAKADDSTEWIRLKCFDSIKLKGSNSTTFFAGGPIQSSAFFIAPHDVKVNQYIAVAVGNAIYRNHSYTNTQNISGIIQIWNLGSRHKRKLHKLNQLPSMELALYHDNGIITEMKWSPANCWDKYCSARPLPRLGKLAAAASDSCVYVYNIPQPGFMPKSKPFPIYFTQPALKLTPLFGEASNATKKTVTTCLEWEKSGKRIVAGYGNGSVCVWMTKVPSYTSEIGVKQVGQSHIIQPYLFFQAAGTPITSLSFAPFSNNRWLIVLSEDGYVKFYDLLDTSAPFMIVKQGLGSNCVWGENFCGVYTAPTLNSQGQVSLSVTDIYAESLKAPLKKDKEKSLSRIIQKNGIFDSSTNLASSANGRFHAIADMTGAVLVNFLANQPRPLETSYLTYMLLETEIVALDSADLEMKTSHSKINISGNILRNEISSFSDSRNPFYTKVKQESSASSSSSGFCSPKNSKTFVIEMAQCFEDDIGNSLKCSSDFNNFKNKNNEKKYSLNSGEETNDKKIKCLEFVGDLMHDLLMIKVSNQSKISSHILPFNNSNHSAYCNSKCVEHLSGGSITSPAASDYTGDTIIYPKEDYYCDTSHSKALNSADSSLGLNEKRNTLHETSVHKMNGKLSAKLEYFIESSSNFACPEVKSGNSGPNNNSSSRNCSEPNTENCSLNSRDQNLLEIDKVSSNHLVSFIHNDSSPLNDYCHNSKHSYIHREEYGDSNKSSKKVKKNGEMKKKVKKNGGMKSKGMTRKKMKGMKSISKKNAINLSKHKSFDDNLCDVLRLNNLNQPKLLQDMYSSTTSNDFVCDRDQKLSFGDFHKSSTFSDYSGDTIIYHNESNDYSDVKYLNLKKPCALSRSLCKRKQDNTFQDTSLPKVEEEAILHGSKTKLFSEKCHNFTKAKHENFLEKDSLKCNSEYETGSATESFSFSDDNRNLDGEDILMSNFHLLNSEYLCDKSDEGHTSLNKLQQSGKDPQKLSYENLISSFGVIFKNSLDKSINPLVHQNHGIYVKHNPLSVIKTISWNPNLGCQSFLFVGGSSGIGRLVFVPDYLIRAKSLKKRKH